MNQRTLLTLLLSTAVGASLPAPADGQPPRKSCSATRLGSSAPTIDGRLDEPAWQGAGWEDDFLQREPNEGQPPSERTAFKILYDDDSLYVGLRAFDSEPARIEHRLSRRDTADGDWVAVDIDSYLDRRTAFRFGVNAAGVKWDLVIASDGDEVDDNWDPIWDVATADVEEGWTAEMRIPLSQLRFASEERLTWGFQVGRRLFRKGEYSVWQPIPRDAAGWVHGFGDLRDLDGLRPSRQIELAPYAVGQYETLEPEAGNPFASPSETGTLLGLDGKVGVTNDLTMTFTVNPDFGQVEADPSVVNLTAYETYYEEKRPFFVEGRNILHVPLMIGDGPYATDSLFYTRRIGDRPSRDIETEDGEFLSSPENTSILGALKLTGKTRGGLSIGVIDGVTARETAQLSSAGVVRDEPVEPLTNYFALRLQQDYGEGRTSLGAMLTATHRDLDPPALGALHSAAYTGAFDFSHSWKDRTYFLVARGLFSYVQGSEEALLETQESSVRYFQRPDAGHLTLDPTRRSLGGHGGTVYAAKFGNAHLRYMAGATWRSPGLELNDMGYLRQADTIMAWAWAGYRIWEPFWIFREVNVNANQWRGWDFSATNTFDGHNINAQLELKNEWQLGGGISRDYESLSPSALRGGPSLRNPGYWQLWESIQTDGRRALQLELNANHIWGDDASLRRWQVALEASLRPSSALNLSLEPSLSLFEPNLQYVDTLELGTEPRYLMGHVRQKTLALTLRLNLSLTPNLSIQLYGQPFVSAGDYSRFKRVTEPRAEAYTDRFEELSDAELTFDPTSDRYSVDEDGDGLTDYAFDNPDFSFRELRSNLVLRWEYRPGSALYLVWSQGRTGDDSSGNLVPRDDLRRLFEIPPHNVFLAKLSYCFDL